MEEHLMTLTRRTFLQGSAAAGMAAFLPPNDKLNWLRGWINFVWNTNGRISQS